MTAPRYAELQAVSNFSFLRGASHPDELVVQAALLGHAAIAVTDRNSLAGIVRAHKAAKQAGIRLIVGCRLDLEDGSGLLCYPTDRAAYGRLTRLLTLGKRRAGKAECRLGYADVAAHGQGQIVLALPPEAPGAAFRARLGRLAADFAGRAYLTAQHRYDGNDAKRLQCLADLAAKAGLPLVATNDVLYHTPERRALQDVVTCIREGCAIEAAGWRLAANAERHLKPSAEMARLFRSHPEAVARTVEIARRCRFSLDELRYEYPDEVVEGYASAQEALAVLAWKGAARHFPDGVPARVRDLIERELALVAKLGYAPYFLTVHDIVRFAESRGILCQGRGSAANSVLCYCLDITAVDPTKIDVLFERFVSAARNEPPDIDVDFEHERREEVIQYIYKRYGRHRAGLAATVICYRTRGALREVGKVFGLSADTVKALTSGVWGWSEEGLEEAQVRQLGLDPADPTLRRVLALAADLIGFPRHLSQHVGGFVVTRGPLCELVPIENAAMADRTVIEWDKDDLDALGILKIDVLALGMLTCIRKAFELIRTHYGKTFTLKSVPQDDPTVYEMLSRADSIGVFQVESRAQMSMLPRLKPREFYDLVIEVAIVRPGPIQGDMVHPYLRRREGRERVEYPSQELHEVLGKTLGVPLFQEQAMRIAMVAAGFSAEEADELRRAMATFKRNGDIHRFEAKMVEGMVARGYEREFAERCFSQIRGFGTYGFPESHAASFALLVYISAWIKRHYPDAFAAALLNSQPMGFYAPAQIVRDASEHGVEIRGPDVNASHWDCTLEPRAPSAAGSSSGAGNRWALRLGLREIKGFRRADADALVARRAGSYASPRALWADCGFGAAALEKLAVADAFRSMGLDRRQALWAIKGLGEPPPPLLAAAIAAEFVAPLPPMRLGEHVAEDYDTLGLSLRQHPLAFLRDSLAAEGVVCAADLAYRPVGHRLTVAGLALIRQRPGTAKDVVFVTLEDETGIANLIVWPGVFERFRRAVMGATLLACTGKLQREGAVIHVIAERLADFSPRLAALRRAPPGDAAGPAPAPLRVRSRDFR